MHLEYSCSYFDKDKLSIDENHGKGVRFSISQDHDLSVVVLSPKDAEGLSLKIQAYLRDVSVGEGFNSDDYPLPEWATKRSNGDYMVLGAQLCTRDGRRTGNAFVNSDPYRASWDDTVWLVDVVTDAGNELTLTENECWELFWPPSYIMSVDEARKKFTRGGKDG
jgi:hypothetical protein